MLWTRISRESFVGGWSATLTLGLFQGSPSE
jgi:hypothetical protein